MEYNLHTHTKRCGHASGEDEEYVKAAMEAGIKTLGFSDHAPFLFPDGKQQPHCVQIENAEKYIKSILRLKEKYSDFIDIHVGFEMEYYPTHFDEMLGYVKGLGAEYLILGQHAIYDGKYFVHGIKESEEDFNEFIRCTLEAMKKGVFSYVAHPDLMQLSGNDELYLDGARRLAVASRELDIPLEINLLGVRGGRCYPSEKFWKVAGEEGSPVTVGIDAHAPSALLEKEAFPVAKWLIKKYHLNYVEMANIRKLT